MIHKTSVNIYYPCPHRIHRHIHVEFDLGGEIGETYTEKEVKDKIKENICEIINKVPLDSIIDIQNNVYGNFSFELEYNNYI